MLMQKLPKIHLIVGTILSVCALVGAGMTMYTHFAKEMRVQLLECRVINSVIVLTKNIKRNDLKSERMSIRDRLDDELISELDKVNYEDRIVDLTGEISAIGTSIQQIKDEKCVE